MRGMYSEGSICEGWGDYVLWKGCGEGNRVLVLHCGYLLLEDLAQGLGLGPLLLGH